MFDLRSVCRCSGSRCCIGRVPVSLAATTGIHGATELIKYILAGADIGMCASALLSNGIPWIKNVLADLELYMKDMPFQSIDALRGKMSQQSISDPTAFERSNYIQILENRAEGRQPDRINWYSDARVCFAVDRKSNCDNIDTALRGHK